jgi:phenylacetate-coenzyme A ligase PaaK-like adenylate-forming protein
MSKFEELKVPDPQALKSVQALCDHSHPYETGEDMDALFLDAMRESMNWHYERCDFYKKLLDREGFHADDLKTAADLPRIPFIHANFFKTHQIRSIREDKIVSTMTSSGTMGQKSQMFFDEWSIKSSRRMVDFVYDHFGWFTPEKEANYLVSNYEPEEGSTRGTTNTSKFLTKYAPSRHINYVLRLTGEGTHEFDLFGCIEVLKKYEAEKIPVRLIGFPSFIYFILERMKKMEVKDLKLSKDSLVFCAGGWKGYADKQLSKPELYARLGEQMGIPDIRCRDGFGSVEHSVPYVECDNHHMHIPIWSRAFIRDVKTLEVLDHGKPGYLSFVTPYITSVPAISVMMGDLAIMHSAEECGCGIETPWFEIAGRAGISKNKSCAVSAAELLKKESI